LLKQNPRLAKARDENDWTALHYCCASAGFKNGKEASDAQVRIATMLLEHGADPMAKYTFNKEWPIRPLYHCCGQHDNPAVAEVLFDAGATPYDDETVYHAADEDHRGCLALIERYAEKKKLAAECTKCLCTQLHWGHSRGAPWLLAHGADPNYLHPKYGDSALHSAIKQRSNDKIIRLLLGHGGRPDRRNKAGKTAVQLATKTPRILMVLSGRGKARSR
jgi:ankyrin repeat protein